MDIKEIVSFLKEYDGERLRIMEVCGTHTAAIRENGIPSLLSDKIELISGPGCPVCVTAAGYIDRLCALALTENTCVVTFGDMIRVPGTDQALQDVRSKGGNVHMVYSPFEVIDLAKQDEKTTFVFAAVGFETTTPVYAVLLEKILNENIKNIKLLTALKTMPPAIDDLCKRGNIDGFIAPGHVSVITGAKAFVPLAEKYNIPFVVSGFKGEELLCALYSLVRLKGTGRVLNLYGSVVNEKENQRASMLVDKFFKPCSAYWRGMGIIENSGLTLREEYGAFDCSGNEVYSDSIHKGCCCGEVITGEKTPCECPFFGKACTPENPYGACMVSAEGACFNYFINQ